MARAPLSQLDDWELVNDEQDIRGWPVETRDGNRLGTVSEMIVDTDTQLVEAIVLDTGAEYPNEAFQLSDGVVRLLGAEPLPAEAGGPTEVVGADATSIPRYEEALVAEKTPRQVGAVEITRDVVEEEQTLEVPLTREQVQVRRRVVDRAATDRADAFQEGSVEVPVYEERADVRKEVRVAEELEIGKEAVQDTETVTDTVRSEQLELEREGDLRVEDASAHGESTERH